MKRMKLTTAGRVVIFVIVLALLAGIGGFGYNYYKNNIADDKPISSGTQSGSTSQKPTTKPSAGKTDTSDPVINLSLDEWVGWKPIIDANQGLTTQPGSIFDQLGIKVLVDVLQNCFAVVPNSQIIQLDHRSTSTGISFGSASSPACQKRS